MLSTLQTHLTGAGGLNNNHRSSSVGAGGSSSSGSEGQESSVSVSSASSMSVVCVQTLALLLSDDRLAEHVVPHLTVVAALLVKVNQSLLRRHR